MKGERLVMKTKALVEIRKRILKNFLDIIILKKLKKNPSIGGYDIITIFHRNFHILPSSGSVYSILYRMERQGLIKGTKTSEKRVYVLTKKGEGKIQSLLRQHNNIQNLVKSIFDK